MFVLDTKVLSAMMAPNPASGVAAFVSGQPAELLFTTSIQRTKTGLSMS
jgi:hypothetical protein